MFRAEISPKKIVDVLVRVGEPTYTTLLLFQYCCSVNRLSPGMSASHGDGLCLALQRPRSFCDLRANGFCSFGHSEPKETQGCKTP
jgi:hypothetical protein